MTILIYTFFSLWFIRLVANMLAYVNLWYVKEYRWDRMLIHLRTKQGKRFLLIPFRRPPISPKTISLTISVIIAVTLILTLLSTVIFLRFLLVDLLLFPLTSLFVGIFRLPTLLYHSLKINQAKNKLEQHQPMTVIGITGSYGKTSTKEYLATILSKKYKVLKTEASKNSSIGIAEAVLPKLKPEHNVFIVEMGAYKRGEIKEMTDMVKPQIGIITAINSQHQDLFGSIGVTMKAKYELAAGLTGRRIAIFNADNDYVRKMAQWARKGSIEVWSVGWQSHKVTVAKQYFQISDSKGDLRGISFSLSFAKERERVTAPVLGEHQATNVSLAIAAAVATGMPFRQAVKLAAGVASFAKNMEPSVGINGALFINDTFNNNPDAAIAAIDFLAKTAGRKILVFQPMIELGSFTKVSHEQVGERAGRVCDEIILTNSNFSGYFISGVRKVSMKKTVQVLTPAQAASFIKALVHAGDTILFKGKEAEQVYKKLAP